MSLTAILSAIASNPMTTGIINGVANYYGGKADRKFQKNSRGEMDRLGGELETGITPQQIMQLMPMLQRGIQPFVNQAAGGAAAKFGSRSGKVAGAIGSAATQAMSPMLSKLFSDSLFANNENKRMVFGERSRHSAGSGSGFSQMS